MHQFLLMFVFSHSSLILLKPAPQHHPPFKISFGQKLATKKRQSSQRKTSSDQKAPDEPTLSSLFLKPTEHFRVSGRISDASLASLCAKDRDEAFLHHASIATIDMAVRRQFYPGRQKKSAQKEPQEGVGGDLGPKQKQFVGHGELFASKFRVDR